MYFDLFNTLFISNYCIHDFPILLIQVPSHSGCLQKAIMYDSSKSFGKGKFMKPIILGKLLQGEVCIHS